eukprot:Skav212880  [mRNA]  locus=scaffold1006:158959:172823:+ [translate_table: standard]
MAPRTGFRLLRLAAVLLGGACFVAPQISGLRNRGSDSTVIPRPAGAIEVPGGLKNGVKMVMDDQPYMILSFQSKKQVGDKVRIDKKNFQITKRV